MSPRWCGNDPRAETTPGDREIVEAFAAYLTWAKRRDEYGAEAAGPEPLLPDGTSFEASPAVSAGE